MTSAPFHYLQTKGNPQHPAVIFLHGGGLSSSQWQPQLERLSDRFYCLAPDLPEQGKSVQMQPFSLKDTAQRTAELISNLPARTADVVGLSLGGAVALELVRTESRLVNHLIVSGTSGRLNPWLGRLSIASAGLYRWIKPDTLLNMAYKQFNIPHQYRDLLREDLLRGFNADFTRHFTHALIELQLPAQANALIMVGERETQVAKRAARALTAQISGAHGIVVPRVGHVWNLEAPELFNAVVRAFLLDTPLPPDVKPI